MKFDSYHPFINLVYFVMAITFMLNFNHPVFLAIAYFSVFFWSIKLNGKKSLYFNLCLIPCILFYTGWYSFYNHFGVTVLGQNFIENQITLESIVYGFVRGVVAASIVMEFTCIFAVVTADKIVYLLGRISPKLSLFFSILLRIIPRIGKWAQKTDLARQGVGRSIGQGNIFQRFIHLIGLISITITWTMENLVESAASMQSRGYSLKGRTAFSIYRFDGRDRGFLIALAAGIMAIFMADAARETTILYDPMILIGPVTGVSIICYLVYITLLSLPLILQIIGEKRFEQLRRESYGE